MLQALKITATEAANVARAMKSSDMSSFQSGGIVLDGTKYQFLRSDDDVVLGKKKDHGAVTLQKSKTGRSRI